MKGTAVFLKSAHLCMDHTLADKIFKRLFTAYVVYVTERKQLLITPASNGWFRKMHQPQQLLLKEKNLKGDCSLSIRQLLMDHDLDMNDRVLAYEVIEKTKLIKVFF